MEADVMSRMHSAEHLLNGTMVKLFGCKRSFSAHINKKKSKCDYHFDRDLNQQEIDELEKQINGAIAADYSVSEEFIKIDEAERQFDLSRLPDDAAESIRIIRIGDYDAVPCIGEHVEHSAQIGSFKIISTGFEESVLRIRFKIAKTV